MDLHDLFLIIHLLLFCYWLGGDMGVYYSSGMVIDPSLSNESRVTAAKIMVNLDLVPRICMSLMLTVGGILSEFVGIEHPTWQMAGIILLGPVWLGMVLFIHFNEGKPITKTVTRVDWWFRWVLVIYLLVSVSFSFATGRLAEAPWYGAKLAVFAALVFCGLMIRKFIPDYAIGIHKMAQGPVTDEDNRRMARSLGQCRPFVIAIWIGILVEVYLGVAKPGGEAETGVLSSLFTLVSF